jgi:hypothetical protein
VNAYCPECHGEGGLDTGRPEIERCEVCQGEGVAKPLCDCCRQPDDDGLPLQETYGRALCSSCRHLEEHGPVDGSWNTPE